MSRVQISRTGEPGADFPAVVGDHDPGVIAFPGQGGILAGYEPEHRSGGRGAGRADGVPAVCSR
jgi:hypothetical protein